jgi:hypothetical protein
LINRVLRPYQIEFQNDEGFQVEFEVENANVLAAEEFTVDVTIKDELQTVVFFESVQGSNLEPYSTSVYITEFFYLPTELGKYYLNLDLEFSEDIDPSNNDLDMTFEVVESPGFKLQPGMIHISQLNFTFENAQQEYSSYGLLSTDFEMIAEASGFTSGFINMVTPEMGWVIQNMIFDLTSGYPGLSTMFNLGMEGPVTGIQASAYVSEEPLMEFSALDYIDFNVGLIDYNSAGRNSPIGTIPAPIPRDSIKFKEGGKDDLVWQHGHVNIEQDVNQCGPASVANSFQWLENEQGLPVPHEHKPGIRDTSLVGEIDKAMERDEHDTVPDGKALSGKIKYIDDNNLTDSLKIKHKNRRGKSFVSNDTVKVGNTMSIPNTDTTSLIDWILQELKDGEDVELAIGWDNGGGHWVDLIGGGYVQGVPWLAWVHDANQGYDDMGTPGDTADDTTKANGGITPQTGGYGWSYIIDNKLASVVGNDTSRGTIDLAFSESIDTSKVTSVSEQFDVSLIKDFSLSQNYPNPFNPTTVIKYKIPIDSQVRLRVYNSLGQLVRTLSSGFKKAGSYEITFRSDNLASGVYIYELSTDNFYDSKKMVLIR